MGNKHASSSSSSLSTTAPDLVSIASFKSNSDKSGSRVDQTLQSTNVTQYPEIHYPRVVAASDTDNMSSTSGTTVSTRGRIKGRRLRGDSVTYRWGKRRSRRRQKRIMLQQQQQQEEDERRRSTAEGVLIKSTHFHAMEYKLLKHQFSQFCMAVKGSGSESESASSEGLELTRQQAENFFLQAHGIDRETFVESSSAAARVLSALWRTVSSEAEDSSTLTFSEYIMTMSNALRGTFEERVMLSFRMFNCRDKGFISKSDVLDVIVALHEIGALREDLLSNDGQMLHAALQAQNVDDNHDTPLVATAAMSDTGVQQPGENAVQHNTSEDASITSPLSEPEQQQQQQQPVDNNGEQIELVDASQEPHLIISRNPSLLRDIHSSPVPLPSSNHDDIYDGIGDTNHRDVPSSPVLRAALEEQILTENTRKRALSDTGELKQPKKRENARVSLGSPFIRSWALTPPVDIEDELDIGDDHIDESVESDTPTEDEADNKDNDSGAPEEQNGGKPEDKPKESLEDVLSFVTNTFFSDDDHLTYAQLLEKCRTSTVLIEGLGMFEFFFVPLFQPIAEFMNTESPYTYEGYLWVGRKRIRRFYTVQGGIMRAFVDETKTIEISKRALFLNTLEYVQELDFGTPTSSALVSPAVVVHGGQSTDQPTPTASGSTAQDESSSSGVEDSASNAQPPQSSLHVRMKSGDSDFVGTPPPTKGTSKHKRSNSAISSHHGNTLVHGFSVAMPGKKPKLFFAESKESRQRWIFTILLYTLSSLDNRFNSHFPVREDCRAVWYVDGKDYFAAAAREMLKAREYIYITGWCLSPSIYLIRNEKNSHEYRLDMILRRKAMEGVNVYILLYKEATIANMNLEAEETRAYLERLHPNIRVILHRGPIEYSHHQKSLVIDQRIAFIGGMDFAFGRYDDFHHLVADQNHCQPTWPGNDYYNPSFRRFRKQSSPLDVFADTLDRYRQPRMPWHDVHCKLTGFQIVHDVAVNFVTRWNHHCRYMGTRLDIKKPSSIYELYAPAMSVNTEGNAGAGSASSSGNAHMSVPLSSLFRYGTEAHRERRRLERQLKQLDREEFSGPRVTCQIVRSIDAWSGSGDRSNEQSIHEAMVYLISRAEHYIYIENQFFISSCAGGPVRNGIGNALIDRIRRAINNEQTGFRVVIVLPVHSEGNIHTSFSVHQVFKWQAATINRSQSSVLQTLQREFPDVDISKYISFYCLKQYGFLDRMAVHTQVYVHSKVMIVDDRYAIIGSANINDRSLLGFRDSELSVVIEDQQTTNGRLNGSYTKVGKFCKTLRLHLWKEHLGMLYEADNWAHNIGASEAGKEYESTRDYLTDQAQQFFGRDLDDFKSKVKGARRQMLDLAKIQLLEDPIEAVDRLWRRRAEKNTKIYNEVFDGTMECDKFRTLSQFTRSCKRKAAALAAMSLEEREKKYELDRRELKKVKGYVINYPLNFLADESFKKPVRFSVVEDRVFI